jgi:glycosyltransferase involved in cell wall biosynthesis
LVGEWQKEDPEPFNEAQRFGATIVEKVDREVVNVLLNMSHCLVQSSDYWGGGQRATLEAMAAGVPVICMEDSPKNREYVEESGCGLIVPPEPEAIRIAVEEIKTWSKEKRLSGVAYVQTKHTARHYALNLLDGVCELVS